MTDASSFLGMGKRESQNHSEKLNLIYRLIRVDDRQMQSYPSDTRQDRVCIEIDDNKVTKAEIK